MHKKDKGGADMEAVYQEYAELVYRFLYSHTHDADWSQELMQETFLRAVDSIARYDGSCKLSVWLCQIAKHLLWQDLRRRKRMDFAELPEELPDTSGADGETSVIRGERTQELYRAIHLLPELEREVPPDRGDPGKERELEQDGVLPRETEDQKGAGKV